MAKQNSKNTKTESEPVAAPAPAAAAAPAPAPEEKKAKKQKTQKSETTLVSEVAAPVVSPAPVVAPTTEDAVVDADGEAPLAEQSVEFLGKIHQLGVLVSGLKAEYRVLQKKWGQQLKKYQAQTNKRKRKSGNRAPSGFVKPTRISEELAKFLGKEAGTEMARTDVTREIDAYIKANNLRDKDNGRKIHPDNKLAALLKLKKTDELTYFNLQRFMSPHFAKAAVPVAAPATA